MLPTPFRLLALAFDSKPEVDYKWIHDFGEATNLRSRARAHIYVFAPRNSINMWPSTGVNWVLDRWRRRKNVILADEMGLGKTAQTVCVLRYLSTRMKQHEPRFVMILYSLVLF